MCGRFVSSSNAEDIAKYFDVDRVSEQALAHEANYNTAPTTDVFVVYSDGSTRNLDTFHWGLVPRWAKDLRIGNKLINARAETVAEKPAFRSAFKKRRCIMPVDGFYEWNKPEGTSRKQPWFIHRPDGEPYAFAGLWEEWRGTLPSAARDGAARDDAAAEGDGEPDEGLQNAEVTVRSSTIITGSPNEKMAELHHRMPVILPASAWEEWLDPNTDVATLGRLLVPAPKELITFHPVSVEVNNVRNKGEQLTEPIELDQPQGAADSGDEAQRLDL
ncbi:MAG: SOS response-associated peptidase [Microthrixaceae bacterium]|nr:SOS response-associated peptidase [Microthrixaceae bacterium]MCB9386589.1 SOS response-associated peptidase [Microthrixaceae bacterium]MCO5320042.1 SOS response-associated peptidase [Microthrixaceae bacterium]